MGKPAAYPSPAPSPSAGCLEIREKDGTHVARLPLGSDAMKIGRAPGCAVCLDHDTVSREHAQLYCDPFGRWWIRDLGSRNGIKVNGKKTGDQVVGAADVIRIGKFNLLLRPVESPRESEPSCACPPISDIGNLEFSTLDGAQPPRMASDQIASVMSLGQLLHQTADRAERRSQICSMLVQDQFQSEAAMILQLGRDATSQPKVLVAPHFSHAGDFKRLHISRTLLRAVLEKGHALLASNTRLKDTDVEVSVSSDVLKISAAACPLQVDEQGLEAIYVVLPPKCALPEKLALLSLVAAQYQQAETDWSARQDIETRAAVEQDLRRAREIQERLVPKTVAIPGVEVGIAFEPCRWVGGDYVDVIPMAEGRVLIAIADACGHGLQAALVASCVHTMVRAGVRARLPLQELMEALNEHLIAYLPTGSFVTMFAGVLDCRRNKIEYVSAGHPPVLMLRSNKAIEQLESTAMPLGVSNERMTPATTTMVLGDALAAFTDGWTETKDRSGIALSTSQFVAVAADAWKRSGGGAVSDRVAQMVRDLDAQREPGSPADDRTLIAVRRT